MNPKISTAISALQQGRKADAARLLIEAFTEDPAAPAAHYGVLLNLLLELGRNQDGLAWSQRALAQAPRDYTLLNLHGAFLRLTGRREEAFRIFDRAIKLRPGEIAARANKGHVHNDAKQGAAAEAVFAALVRQHPRIAELQRSLGVALLHQEKFDQAERRFRQAASLDPKSVDAWLDLSALTLKRGGLTAGLAVIDEAMARGGTGMRLVRARVAMLLSVGLRDDAATYLRSLPPIDAPWFDHDLARSLMHSEPEEAARLHRRAVTAAPDDRDFRLAFAEHMLRNAIGPEGTHIDHAHQIVASLPLPDEPTATETRIRAQIAARAVDCDALEDLGSFTELGRQWANSGVHTALLDHLARVTTPDDRRELLHQHRLWGDAAIARARDNPINSPPPRAARGKIRIGFMSSDLREHPVTYFAWPLFEHVDRERFEIYCYSFYRGASESPLQRRLSSMVDSFRWEPVINDRDAAQMIADDDIDILFELGGSTFMNKLDVMAWKPAKICASWLGYPHSSGLTTIDYLLVDPWLTPPDAALLLEKPMTMPHSWIAMSPLAFPEDYRIRADPPVARNGHVTFGTANNTYKFTPDMLRAWARVMVRVPNSRFIFIRPEVGARIVVEKLRAVFSAEGVSPDRLEFRPVKGSHMAHYNDIDIALDTFPQTGGTTTCEALWMGVPSVTLVGEALFERLSYSILTNAGLADLCATSVDDFIDIAAGLAGDPARIADLRSGLRDRIRSGPLGRTEDFARDFYDLVTRTVQDAATSPAGAPN